MSDCIFVNSREENIIAIKYNACYDFLSSPQQNQCVFYGVVPEHTSAAAVKVTLKYYNGNILIKDSLDSDDEEIGMLNASFTTKGFVEGIHISTECGWTVSRWTYNYGESECSCIISRRDSPMPSYSTFSLILSDVITFAALNNNEYSQVKVIFNLFDRDGKIIAEDTASISKTIPSFVTEIQKFIPAGDKYVLSRKITPELVFKVTDTQYSNITLTRQIGVESVKLEFKENAYLESKNINELLKNHPSEKQIKYILSLKNSEGEISVDTYISTFPLKIVNFAFDNLDKPNTVVWDTLDVENLFFNGKSYNDKDAGSCDVEKEVSICRLLVMSSDGYIAKTITRPKNGSAFDAEVEYHINSSIVDIRLKWTNARRIEVYFCDKNNQTDLTKIFGKTFGSFKCYTDLSWKIEDRIEKICFERDNSFLCEILV